MPALIRAAKRSLRKGGVLGGASLAVGLAFFAIFDPPAAAAVETIRKKKDLGDVEKTIGGEPLD